MSKIHHLHRGIPAAHAVRSGAARRSLVSHEHRTTSRPLQPAAPVTAATTDGLIRAGFVVIALLAVAFVTWGRMAPLSSAAVAPGVVKVSGDRREVEHLEGGILRKALVADGDQVTAGQVLVQLDDAKHAANRKLLEGKLFSALAREARLVAERDGESSVVFQAEIERSPDSEAQKLASAQRALFDSRRATMLGALRLKDERSAQIKEEINALSAQIKSGERQLVYLNEELGDLKSLMNKGLTRKPRLLAIQRQAEALDGDIRQKQSLIARSRKELAAVQEEKLQLERERHDEITRELREVADEAFDARQRIAVLDEQMGRLALQAPIAGTVIGLGTKTSGAVVAAGERLLEIVPADSELVIEASLRPDDIDGVDIGSAARIRIMAFNARRTPVMIGTVLQVSADRLERSGRNGQSPTLPANDPQARPYYKVAIRLPAEAAARAGLLLKPGMPAEVYLEKRKLTLLDYLLSPLLIGIDRAFQGQ
jgi:HlyD family type I secretion membrane fusion protein